MTPHSPNTSSSPDSSPRPDSRHRIVDAAIDLFAQRGYHASSMRDIAEGAGIKAASIYAHFGSKEALLRAILAEYTDELASLRVTEQRLQDIVATATTETIFVEGFKAIREGLARNRTEKMVRMIYNEMFKNPIVAEFGIDWLREGNLREFRRIFSAMQKHHLLKVIDLEFVSLLYNAVINNYFQDRFVRKLCGRDVRALDEQTLDHLRLLAGLLS